MRTRARRSAPVEEDGKAPGAHVTLRLRVAALLRYADDFLRAAKKSRTRSASFAPAQYYLACHAIELALAAYRALDDSSAGAWRRAAPRPDLGQALADAKSRKLLNGVALQGRHEMEVRKAALYYKAMVFEYPATAEAIRGYPNAPDIDTLIVTGSALVDALRMRLPDLVMERRRERRAQRRKR